MMINTLLEHVPIKLEAPDNGDDADGVENNGKQKNKTVKTNGSSSKNVGIEAEEECSDDDENEDEMDNADGHDDVDDADDDDDEEDSDDSETDLLEDDDESTLLPISSDEEAELEAQRIRFHELISKTLHLPAVTTANKKRRARGNGVDTQNLITKKLRERSVSSSCASVSSKASIASCSSAGSSTVIVESKQRQSSCKELPKQKQQQQQQKGQYTTQASKHWNITCKQNMSVGKNLTTVVERVEEGNTTTAKEATVVAAATVAAAALIPSNVRPCRTRASSTCSVASSLVTPSCQTESCGNIYVYEEQQKLIFTCSFCDLRYGEMSTFAKHLYDAHKLFKDDEDNATTIQNMARKNTCQQTTTITKKQQAALESKAQAQDNKHEMKVRVKVEVQTSDDELLHYIDDGSSTHSMSPIPSDATLESCGNVFILNYKKLFLICGHCECKYATLDLFHKHLRQQHQLFNGPVKEIDVLPKREIKQEVCEEVEQLTKRSVASIESEKQRKASVEAMADSPAMVVVPISQNLDNNNEILASSIAVQIPETPPPDEDKSVDDANSTSSNATSVCDEVEYEEVVVEKGVDPEKKLRRAKDPENMSKRAKQNFIADHNVMGQQYVVPEKKVVGDKLVRKEMESLQQVLSEENLVSEKELVPEEKPVSEEKTVSGAKMPAEKKEHRAAVEAKLAIEKRVEPQETIDNLNTIACETESTRVGGTATTRGKTVCGDREKKGDDAQNALADEVLCENKIKVVGDKSVAQQKIISDNENVEQKENNTQQLNEVNATATREEHAHLESEQQVDGIQKTIAAAHVVEEEAVAKEVGEQKKEEVEVKLEEESEQKPTTKRKRKRRSVFTRRSPPKRQAAAPKTSILSSTIQDNTLPTSETVDALPATEIVEESFKSNNITGIIAEQPQTLTKSNDDISNVSETIPSTDLAAQNINKTLPPTNAEVVNVNEVLLPTNLEIVEPVPVLETVIVHAGPDDGINNGITYVITEVQTENVATLDNNAITKPDVKTKVTANKKQKNTKAAAPKRSRKNKNIVIETEKISIPTIKSVTKATTTSNTITCTLKSANDIPVALTSSSSVSNETLLIPSTTTSYPTEQYVSPTRAKSMAVIETGVVDAVPSPPITAPPPKRARKRKATPAYLTSMDKDVEDVQSEPTGKQMRTTSYSETHKMRFACKQCPRSFSKSPRLAEHQRLHTGEKPYACDECGKTFRIKRRLTEHELRHKKIKAYKCERCGLPVATKQDLRLHERHHTNDRRYSCTECSKAFVRSSDLKIHKRVHTGEKPYECEICHKTFRANQNLLVHRRSHMGEKNFKCDYCDKHFMRNIDRKVHHRTHTGEKPFKCEICDRGYSSRTHVRSHIQREHVENKNGRKKYERKSTKETTVPLPTRHKNLQQSEMNDNVKQQQMMDDIPDEILECLKTDDLEEEYILPTTKKEKPTIEVNNKQQQQPKRRKSTPRSSPALKKLNTSPQTHQQQVQQKSKHSPTPPNATIPMQQVAVTVSMQVQKDMTIMMVDKPRPEKENATAIMGSVVATPLTKGAKNERKITSYFNVLGQKTEI